MSVTPVVKFQFVLEAAGSASCNETLYFNSSQQRLLLKPWLLLVGEGAEIWKEPGEQQKQAGS